MKKFPKSLTASPGIESKLEPSMMLVSFKKPMEMDNVQSIAKELKLVVFSGDGPNDNARWKRVNHTNTRFWLKSEDGKAISDARFEEIEKSLGDRIEWIGPVYENYSRKGAETCFCPIPNVVLLPKTKDSKISSIAKIAKDNGLTLDEKRSKYLSTFYYLQVPASGKTSSAFELKNKLAASGQEMYFENMPLFKPLAATSPNDPLWTNQWDMLQINAPNGWDITKGSSQVVICILDEGCDLNHPDLKFSEQGINLGTMQPPGSPTGAHGTACAGIAAATMNNNAGVAGVASDCYIMPLAFLYWTDIECAIGINYATTNGAHVISMSFGVYDGWGWDYAVIDPEIQNAFDNNVVLVAASGNEDDGFTNRYPGRHPLVIAVGGSSVDDNRKSPNSPDGEYWWGANYGEEYYNGVLTGLSVVAPCVLCPTTDIQGGDGYSGDEYMPNFNGTSSATPHVAGLAALLKSQNPALSNVQIREIIEKTAAKVGVAPYAARAEFPNGTRNQEMGYGRIDVFAALSFNNAGGSGCSGLKEAAKLSLLEMANSKANHISSLGSCPDFQVFNGAGGCQSLKVKPCFYLHWGDSAQDVIDTDDFEVVVLSVCNPFDNVEFRGVTLSEIEITHADGTPVELLPNNTPVAMVVPSKLISFCSVAPCSCSHIELVLKTSSAIAGPYKIKFNCCIDKIILQTVEGDRPEFDVALVNS